MSDAPEAPDAPTTDHEVVVELAAFLPEGTVLAGPDDDLEPDAADAETETETDGAPEVEADAEGETEVVPTSDVESVAEAEAEAQVAAGVDVGESLVEAAPARPPLDVAVLERIEGELAAVDAALVAIDAGEPERSALLAELLADDPAG